MKIAWLLLKAFSTFFKLTNQVCIIILIRTERIADDDRQHDK